MQKWFSKFATFGMIAGLSAIVLMFSGVDEFVPALLAFICVCLVTAIWLRARVYRSVYRHRGVVIRYIQEGPHVWSSHICGRELRVIGQAVRQRLWRLLKSVGKAKPLAYTDRQIRLFEDRADRQRINELSLKAFELMLDELGRTPGAALISASALNFKDRQPRRLYERIQAVEQRPAWTYLMVYRRLRRTDTIFGRRIFNWPVRQGEGRRAIVPGIVAWRCTDPVPDLESYDLMTVSPEAATDTVLRGVRTIG